MSEEKILVVGLGYVGLPVALAFARHFEGVVGLDIDAGRIRELNEGYDRTGEVDKECLKASSIRYVTSVADVGTPSFIVVTVPTPIDENRQPDLRPLEGASRSIAPILSKGSVVVYESTVYPGVTEDVCGPILEELSGLKRGEDFKLGYSPERINPGDKVQTLENTVKVVSGEDEETLERVANVYTRIIDAGVHRAPTIKVAESAKVIENTQRDLNIALMNELALIFDRLGIRTSDVLAAAGTKWNFLKFFPGLVGGHCIGVDPYYLTARAESAGYHPDVILAGRRINDEMGAFIARRLVKMLIAQGRAVRGARVGVLGLTFKENVPDLRNSRVPDIITELQEFGAEVLVHDPRANPEEAMEEYGVQLCAWDELQELCGVVLAVAHDEYKGMETSTLLQGVVKGGALVDVKSMIAVEDVPDALYYWSL